MRTLLSQAEKRKRRKVVIGKAEECCDDASLVVESTHNVKKEVLATSRTSNILGEFR